MIKVFAGAENMITSLGFNAEENASKLLNGETGIRTDDNLQFAPELLPLSLVDHTRLNHLFTREENKQFSTLEKMFIASIRDALSKVSVDARSGDTLFLFTTTKGNIELLDAEREKHIPRERVLLPKMAGQIINHFKNPNTPLIISNACVSGVLGLIYGMRYIRSGKFKHVIVSGGDLISEFIVSGFLSFQSLSMQACKPFDKKRDGLSLGEGCGTIILSAMENSFRSSEPFLLLGGAGSNDANHISGPSRTGDGLQIAINHALETSGLKPEDIDTISAHGTATDYNDEMEAKAFYSAGLNKVPLNSYKGYIGHTLGAAGVIEAALSMQSMRKNMLFSSAGYSSHGVSKEINVIKNTLSQKIDTCLKTASGFGGSNAAVILQKQKI